MSAVTIRPATQADDAALVAIERATWSLLATPSPPPAPRTTFLARVRPADVLVAVVDGAVAGYAQLGPAETVDANRHVLMLRGLAVDPPRQGRGVGRRLVSAAVAEARRRGGRRLRLRVLGHNAIARRVYGACGFVVEGVLRDEFLLDSRYVDDVFMARDLTSDDEGPA
jgi:ribosomal protein S18 acetylase RimI-like enzyme